VAPAPVAAAPRTPKQVTTPRSTRVRSGLVTAGLLAGASFWYLFLLVAPLAIIVIFSFGQRSPIGGYAGGFTLDNFARAWTNSSPFTTSLFMSIGGTILCLLVGLPLAYYIATRAGNRKSLLVILLVIPFWTSFLVRTYAWRFLLQDEGPINAALHFVGLEGQRLLYTQTAVLLGQVYGELPFMILPLYSAIERLNPRLLEAASDLGADRVRTFLHVTLPLTKTGIVAGIVLVFVPSLGAFITPDLLGGAKSMMIGSLIQEQFAQRNQPFGAAVSFLLAAVVLVLLAIAWRAGARSEE
jgi:spermidine/putrescine transport system permease protein